MSLPQQRQSQCSQESRRGCAAVCWLVAADKANNYYSRSRKLPWSVAGLTTSRRFHSRIIKSQLIYHAKWNDDGQWEKMPIFMSFLECFKTTVSSFWTIQFSPTTSFTFFFFRNTNFYVNWIKIGHCDLTEILHFIVFRHFFVQ